MGSQVLKSLVLRVFLGFTRKLLMRAKNLSMDEAALKDWIIAQKDINPKGLGMEDLTEDMMNKVLQRIVKMDTDRQKETTNA